MPAGRVLRFEPGRRSVHVERRGRIEELELIDVASDGSGVDVVTRPVALVRRWLAALAAGDRDGLLALYRPTAVVHWRHGLAQGPAAIGDALDSVHLAPAGPEAAIRAVDRLVVVDPAPESNLPSLAFVVATDGPDPEPAAIVEQWIGVDPRVQPGPDGDTDGTGTADGPGPDPGPIEPEALTLVCRGAVSEAAARYAREKVARLVAHHAGAGRHPEGAGGLAWGQVKLSYTGNPADGRSCRAEVTVDLDGRLVRAQAAESTMPEAIDEVVERLRANLGRLADRRRHSAEGTAPTPGHWRHGNRPTAAPPWVERPRDEREVVRHKSFAPARLSVDDARWDLDLLGYDFLLFTEQSSGIDCVLAHDGARPGVADTGGEEAVVELHGLAHRPDLGDRLARPGVVVVDRPVPRLTVTDALDLLDAGGARFELFDNAATGRRNVVYRRHDGHYGLITPPPPAPEPPPSEERMIHEGRSPA